MNKKQIALLIVMGLILTACVKKNPDHHYGNSENPPATVDTSSQQVESGVQVYEVRVNCSGHEFVISALGPDWSVEDTQACAAITLK